MNGPRFASIAWLPLIALFGVSCDFDLSGPREDPAPRSPELPEDRGVALTADEVSWDSHLVWSRDGREIFYQQSALWTIEGQARPPTLKAVDGSNKTTRTVDARYSAYHGLTCPPMARRCTSWHTISLLVLILALGSTMLQRMESSLHCWPSRSTY